MLEVVASKKTTGIYATIALLSRSRHFVSSHSIRQHGTVELCFRRPAVCVGRRACPGPVRGSVRALRSYSTNSCLVFPFHRLRSRATKMARCREHDAILDVSDDIWGRDKCGDELVAHSGLPGRGSCVGNACLVQRHRVFHALGLFQTAVRILADGKGYFRSVLVPFTEGCLA